MTDGGVVNLESGIPYKNIRELVRRGHNVKYTLGGYGGYQAILWDKEKPGLLRGFGIQKRRSGCRLLNWHYSLSLYTLIQSISMAEGSPLSEASFFRLEEKLMYISSWGTPDVWVLKTFPLIFQVSLLGVHSRE
jgi:hypothetical protein